jgi:prepilin peptidase CpaA
VDLLSNIAGEGMTIFQWGVVIGASLVAACGDLRERRIPNALTFPLLAVGLIWASWAGGLSGLAEAAAACVLLALPYVLMFMFAGGGAGDAKLMGAIGAWLGLRQGAVVFVCVAVAGAVLAIAKAIEQRELKSVVTSILVSIYTFMLLVISRKTPRLVEDRPDKDRSGNKLDIPYGVAIFAGVCATAAIVWLWGVEWLW